MDIFDISFAIPWFMYFVKARKLALHGFGLWEKVNQEALDFDPHTKAI